MVPIPTPGRWYVPFASANGQRTIASPEAWIVDYVDGQRRRLKTFGKKMDADAFNTRAKAEIAKSARSKPTTRAKRLG